MPKYPKKKIAQLILQQLVQHKIDKVVISPGSRNAPLTLGMVNHPEIECFSIVDERTAAFFALGMAQQLKKPVALLCTSGSAVLNYFAAVAEAYYSRIPLIIISADRPKHLIDIGDGQTIRQKGVFGAHILEELHLDDITDFASGRSEEIIESVSSLFEISMRIPGPVHLNVAFDEPLYETVTEMEELPQLENKEEQPDSLLDEKPLELEELEPFAEKWNKAQRKVVLVGAMDQDTLLRTQMSHLLKDPSVLVFTESTSNLSGLGLVQNIDQLLFPMGEKELEELQPEILLTFGGMVVSKKVKQWLRKNQPKEHWHIDKNRAFDTYHCLSHHFKISPQLFFSQFFFLTSPNESDYQPRISNNVKNRKAAHSKYVDSCDYSDLWVFDQIVKTLPDAIQLQLGNSSIVRYSQLYDLAGSIKVYCNRGTSGIDGSTSTAIGAARVSNEPTVLITGDISFFYDSNALWNKYVPNNFKVILVNNSGGGIFRFIPGPKSSDALDFFETSHHLDASHLCKMYGWRYQQVATKEDLKSELSAYFSSEQGPSLLEIKTPPEVNELVLKEYFKALG